MGRRLIVLLLSFMIIPLFATNVWAEKTFDEEFALSIRAGKGEITDQEKQDLLKENHPILMQIGDSNTLKLIKLFANLPNESHKELEEKNYLKWEFKALDQSRQKVCEDIVLLQIDMVKQQGVQPQPGFSLEELKNVDVGFAVVEMPSLKQKTVSWYILWPKLTNPTWVTVVNGRLAGTPEYFQSHMQRLSALKSMPLSKTPE